MKSLKSFLLAIFCISTSAFVNPAKAQLAPVPFVNPAGDRVELYPGIYGISHTENFEYVCDVEAAQGGESMKIKTYLDVDFAGGTGYRYAAGFVGGGVIQGIIAAEAEVFAAEKGRCPGLCLLLTLRNYYDGSLSSFQYKEDPITKAISFALLDGGESTLVGTCEKNELP